MLTPSAGVGARGGARAYLAGRHAQRASPDVVRRGRPACRADHSGPRPWRAGWARTPRSDACTSLTRGSCCSATGHATNRLVSPGRVPRARTAAPSDGGPPSRRRGPGVDRLTTTSIWDSDDFEALGAAFDETGLTQRGRVGAGPTPGSCVSATRSTSPSGGSRATAADAPPPVPTPPAGEPDGGDESRGVLASCRAGRHTIARRGP